MLQSWLVISARMSTAAHTESAYRLSSTVSQCQVPLKSVLSQFSLGFFGSSISSGLSSGLGSVLSSGLSFFQSHLETERVMFEQLNCV